MAVCVRRDHVWIGLHATSQGGNLHHFWPDCDQLTYTDFNPWQNSSDDQKEGCVMFHPSSPSYSVVDCSSSLPYICENRETGNFYTRSIDSLSMYIKSCKNHLFLFSDPLQCFFPETNSAVRSSFSISSSYSNASSSYCAEICHEVGSCAGVMHLDICKILGSVNPPSPQDERDTLYLDSKYYMGSINLRWVPTQQ